MHKQDIMGLIFPIRRPGCLHAEVCCHVDGQVTTATADIEDVPQNLSRPQAVTAAYPLWELLYETAKFCSF